MGFVEDNNKERMKFVMFWADFVRTHPDKVWSKQQNVIINSALKSNSMTKNEYLLMKGELRR